jgi:hypothetical protein
MYQGPISEIDPYLAKIGIKIGKFQNMGDFLIKMAIAPSKVRFNLTQQELIDTYEAQIEQRLVRQLESY